MPLQVTAKPKAPPKPKAAAKPRAKAPLKSKPNLPNDSHSSSDVDMDHDVSGIADDTLDMDDDDDEDADKTIESIKKKVAKMATGGDAKKKTASEMYQKVRGAPGCYMITWVC